MAALPTQRLVVSAAFASIGVNYFDSLTGKNELEMKSGSLACLHIQKYDIDVVQQLDTDSCLNVIMQFIDQKDTAQNISDKEEHSLQSTN